MTRAAVAIASTYYPPVLGGAETAAERLAVYLHRRGHAVTVLTTRTSASHPADEILDGVQVVRLPPVGERFEPRQVEAAALALSRPAAAPTRG